MAATAASWSYANNWRVLFAFLGVSAAFLGMGVLGVVGFGAGAVDGATILLGLGIFVMLFALLLLFPRLRRRGVQSFGRIVDRPIEEVEAVVREALEAGGRGVHVVDMPTRARRAARVVRIEGVSTHFVLERFAGPAREPNGFARTEIVQVGVSGESDATAKELRELIESRIA